MQQGAGRESVRNGDLLITHGGHGMETMIMYQVSGAGLGLLITSVLYALGGRAGTGKWIRRYGASLVLAGTVNALCLIRGCWSPYFLLILPLLIGGFSMGYGGDTLGMKVIRRSLYALGVLSSGFLMSVILGAWWVFAFHCCVGAWSVFLGIKNPFEAVAEEFFVCMLLNIGLISYGFVV